MVDLEGTVSNGSVRSRWTNGSTEVYADNRTVMSSVG